MFFSFLSHRGRSVSSDHDNNSESEHSERSPLVSAKLDSLAKLLFSRSLLQDGTSSSSAKDNESPTRFLFQKPILYYTKLSLARIALLHVLYKTYIYYVVYLLWKFPLLLVNVTYMLHLDVQFTRFKRRKKSPPFHCCQFLFHQIIPIRCF